MSSQPQSGLPPSQSVPIRLTARDLARLDALLASPTYRHHPGAASLQRELDRADVLAPDADAAGIVGMHAHVDCVDEHDGSRHTLTLVYPHEADAGAGRVSVLDPWAPPCWDWRSASASTGPASTDARCACACSRSHRLPHDRPGGAVAAPPGVRCQSTAPTGQLTPVPPRPQ